MEFTQLKDGTLHAEVVSSGPTLRELFVSGNLPAGRPIHQVQIMCTHVNLVSHAFTEQEQKRSQ